jgi:hypothetical protein
MRLPRTSDAPRAERTGDDGRAAGWLAAALAAVVAAQACSDPERDRLKATTKPSYDKTTGRLAELTFDANKNGKIDTWTEMDGNRPIRSRIDANEDGRIDRWEYYDEKGVLAKVGFSRKSDGKPDAWAFSTAAGRIDRIEVSSSADEQKIDRWEYYDGSAAPGPDGTGPLSRVEEDTNHDGRRDKWERYESGLVKTAEFDENGDGRPDRRLTYDGADLVLIESAPDASGAYAKKVKPPVPR